MEQHPGCAGVLSVEPLWLIGRGQGSLTELEAEEGLAYDVHLDDVDYWHHVPAEVWEYTLGGDPVLKKWLSYRERWVVGRDLKPEEARAFSAIARRIAAILHLHPALDSNHGAVKRNIHSPASA
jgi:hypothetical protein